MKSKARLRTLLWGSRELAPELLGFKGEEAPDCADRFKGLIQQRRDRRLQQSLKLSAE